RHRGGRRPAPARHRPLPRPRPARAGRRVGHAHPHLPSRAMAGGVLHPRPPRGNGRHQGRHRPALSRRGLGPDYRRLWAAAGVSTLGDGVREAALPLLAASLTHDPGAVAAVTFAGRLPWLLFSLVSGAVVDRVDRKRVMWMVDAGRALTVTALAAAVLLEATSIPLLVIVAFVLGTGETLFDNAAHALMPSVVSRDRLEEANSRLYAIQISSQEFVGPPVGSFLFGAVAVPAPR